MSEYTKWNLSQDMEWSMADIMEWVAEDPELDGAVMDRAVVSCLLRAFDVRACGKRAPLRGGRPASVYRSSSVRAMLRLVKEKKGTF